MAFSEICLQVCDWYSTFSKLVQNLFPLSLFELLWLQQVHILSLFLFLSLSTQAGVDPTDNAEGVPGIDSLDMWPLLSGTNTTSPRNEIPLSSHALISGDWKVIFGPQRYDMWSPQVVSACFLYPCLLTHVSGILPELDA